MFRQRCDLDLPRISRYCLIVNPLFLPPELLKLVIFELVELARFGALACFNDGGLVLGRVFTLCDIGLDVRDAHEKLWVIPEVIDEGGLGGGGVGDVGTRGVHFIAFGEEAKKMGLFGGGEFRPGRGVEEVLIILLAHTG